METLEFTLPTVNIAVLIPHILLTGTALAVLLTGVFAPQKSKPFLGYLALIGVVFSTIAQYALSGTFESAYSGMLIADGFSFYISMIVGCVTILAILASIHYERYFSDIQCGEYYCLLLIAALGMGLMGSAGHFLMLFVALETMSVSIYVLAGMRRNNSASIESALKYFLLGAFASGFLLYGFALVYGATGTMDLLVLRELLQTGSLNFKTPLFMGGVALITCGLGFKVALVPFHMWTPDVYEGAPTPVTAFMAAGVKAAAFAAMIRIFYCAFAAIQADWSTILWVFAFITMTLGNLAALVQNNLKRMLAYSSIAHAGYLMVGFLAGDTLAISAMLFYLMAYAFMNAGAFTIVILLGAQEKEHAEIHDFSGLGLKYPLLGFSMAVCMLSMAGIPPTAGFMGKFYIFSAAIKAGFIWIAIVGVVNSIISLYYYLRIIIVMFFREPGPDATPCSTSVAAVTVVAVATVVVLFLGILPSSVWNIASQSSHLFK